MGEQQLNISGLSSRSISTPEAELFLVEAGDAKKPTILFLHGYPDDHTVWEKQLDFLKDNFHVVALDLRGVGNSELKAPLAGAFRVERITFDIETVINDIAGKKGKVHIVAHDWGSIIAWSALSDSNVQDRVLSFTTISGPHLGMATQWLKESLLSLEPGKVFKALRQLGSAAHFALFNLPFIQQSFKYFPKQWAGLVARMGGLGKVENFTGGQASDSDSVISRFMLPVELYRQNFAPLPKLPQFNGIKVAVQAIVPRKDSFLKPELAECMDPYVGNLKKEFVDGNHWVMKTDAEKINELILQFVEEQEALAKPKRRTTRKTASTAEKKTTTAKSATKTKSKAGQPKKSATKAKAKTEKKADTKTTAKKTAKSPTKTTTTKKKAAAKKAVVEETEA